LKSPAIRGPRSPRQPPKPRDSPLNLSLMMAALETVCHGF
jgi:hypothetical protein